MTAPAARDVFEALAAEYLRRPGTTRRTMFGRDCLLRDGHHVAFLHAERLALRLAGTTAASLLASGEGEVPLMGTRAMRGFVAVGLPDGPEAIERWRTLLAEADPGSEHGEVS